MYQLKSKLRVLAKWQVNYVNLVIFVCKPRNAAEQNMTILFFGYILLYARLRITLFSNLLCEHGTFISAKILYEFTRIGVPSNKLLQSLVKSLFCVVCSS